MKPTPRTTSNDIAQRPLPVTDYNFQTTAETPHAVVGSAPEAPDSRPFWKLSKEVFRPKTSIESVREMIAFGAIAALSAWPIVVALHAITRMVRGY